MLKLEYEMEGDLMKTKGNPVDTVIQYQLHKKTTGGSGNDFPVNITEPQEGQILTFDSVNEEWVNSESRIKVVNLTTYEKVATQDDIDNYGFYYDIRNDGTNDIEIGAIYNVSEISANYNEISNNDIVVIKNNGNNSCFIAVGYEFYDEIYNVYDNCDLTPIKSSYYSLIASVNLRKYVLADL